MEPEPSLFREAIEVLNSLGLYDVILPFLFVFTLMFAIFEKTRMLGTEKINGIDVPRKNLNAMVSFCIALIVIASTRIVNIINQMLASIILFIVLIFIYLLTLGVLFHPNEDEKEFKLPKSVKYSFMAVGAVVIIIIFFQAAGMGGFAGNLGDFFMEHVLTGTVLTTIILLAVLIVAMALIVKEPKGSDSRGEKK
jgi:small-conductance mechanosensitive channel